MFSYYDLSVHVSDGFPKKIGWGWVGGWVGWALSRFILIFLELFFLTFQTPKLSRNISRHIVQIQSTMSYGELYIHFVHAGFGYGMDMLFSHPFCRSHCHHFKVNAVPFFQRLHTEHQCREHIIVLLAHADLPNSIPENRHEQQQPKNSTTHDMGLRLMTLMKLPYSH